MIALPAFRLLLIAAMASALSFGAAHAADDFDLSPQQPGRLHAPRNDAAIAAIPERFQVRQHQASSPSPSAPAALRLPRMPRMPRPWSGQILTMPTPLPTVSASRLEIVPVAWIDWPLGLPRQHDAVISNVGVTEQRKEKLDFSTYRQGLHGLFVKSDSPVAAIKEPKDAAGLRIIVGAGTNQERILVKWSDEDVAAGLKPIELQYYDDEAASLLALRSGRADVIVQPHAQLVFIAARDKNIKRVGTLSAGWPERSDVAIATRKGSGLADALTIATNGLIANGTYAKILDRWQLAEEALPKSKTNPAGLPKY